MPEEKPHLKVFLCHASADEFAVRELYERLIREKWIAPWLAEERLLPGQDWDFEIGNAVESSDVVVVCFSKKSVSQEGYIQKEMKFVLDVALEKPLGSIFIIPIRLEDCEVPRTLRKWQCVDYFPLELRDKSYRKLLDSLLFKKVNQGDIIQKHLDNTTSPKSQNYLKLENTSKSKTPPFDKSTNNKFRVLFLLLGCLFSFLVFGILITQNILSPSNSNIPNETPSLSPIIPSQTPYIIYKSPEEINLRPGDIEGLKEIQSQFPVIENLTSKKEDQSQRAFLSEFSEISIESTVTLMSEPNQLSSSEVINLVVVDRLNSASVTSPLQETVSNGKNTVYAEFSSQECASGITLISQNTNILIILIGCGDNLDLTYLQNILNVIDLHMTTSHEEECAVLNLTDKQCAIHGTHKYNYIYDFVGCSYDTDPSKPPYDKTGEDFETIFFSKNGEMIYTWSKDFTRIDENNYSFENLTDGVLMKGSLIISEDGYVVEWTAGWADKPEYYCTNHRENILIKD